MFLRLVTVAIFFSASLTRADTVTCPKKTLEVVDREACKTYLEAHSCRDIKSLIILDSLPPNSLEKCEQSNIQMESKFANESSCSEALALVGTGAAIVAVPKLVGKIVPFQGFVALTGSFLKHSLPIFGQVATAYSVSSFLADGIDRDKKCYENVDLKQSRLLLEKRKSDQLILKLGSLVDENEKKSISFPSEYLNSEFIKNLSCQRLNEIIENLRKRQDPFVGKFLSKKILTTDPRTELPLSPMELEETERLTKALPCLTKERQAQVVCAIANQVIKGLPYAGWIKSVSAVSTVKKPSLEVQAAIKKASESFNAKSPINLTSGSSPLDKNEFESSLKKYLDDFYDTNWPSLNTPGFKKMLAKFNVNDKSVSVPPSSLKTQSPQVGASKTVQFKPEALPNSLRYTSGKIPVGLIKRFPAIKDKLDDIDKFFDSFDKVKLRKERAKFIKLANTLPYVDDKTSALYQRISSSLTDMKNWATYSKNLFVESAAWIEKNGNTDELRLLLSGEVSRRAVAAVLAQRTLQRGESLQIIKKGEKGDIFFGKVSKGPVVDKYFPVNHDHGQLTHLLQLDYVSPIVAKSPLTSKEFYSFFDTPTGRKYWNDFFDSTYVNSLFVRPESIGALIGGRVLPIRSMRSLGD